MYKPSVDKSEGGKFVSDWGYKPFEEYTTILGAYLQTRRKVATSEVLPGQQEPAGTEDAVVDADCGERSQRWCEHRYRKGVGWWPFSLILTKL